VRRGSRRINCRRQPARASLAGASELQRTPSSQQPRQRRSTAALAAAQHLNFYKSRLKNLTLCQATERLQDSDRYAKVFSLFTAPLPNAISVVADHTSLPEAFSFDEEDRQQRQ